MSNNSKNNCSNTTSMEVEEQIEDLQSVSSESSANLQIIPAVLVQNAQKSYTRGEPVLRNLSMCVASWSIYGLLGASGCGKTTMLSAIVGVKKLDSGNVFVFGEKPGDAEIPRTVGYMPQEIALFQEFTISETLNYFGRLYSMTALEVKARMEFLIEFLSLPESHMLVKDLSGGTKRRMSLAVAMIHRPPLLILDEPTVGLDPLLREKIWNHLQQIVEQQHITIIITTHYIQESGKADRVGIMRNGRLLVEEKPEKLLKEHGTPFLEKVFLKLCADDDQGLIPDLRVDHDYSNKKRRKSIVAGLEYNNAIQGITYNKSTENNNKDTIWTKDIKISPRPKYKDLGFAETASAHANKIYALLIKTLLFLIRTSWFGIVIVLLPPIQIITFLLIVGHDPINIPMGLVNPELSNESLFDFCKTLPTNECFPRGISCRFLNNFPSEEFQWIEYKSDEDALRGVQAGKVLGYFSIPNNYTRHMVGRSLEKNFMTNSTIDGSIITSRLDVSFNLKSDFVKYKAFDYFQTFLKDLASTCNVDPRTVELPLKYNAIYGGLGGSTYRNYIQPGFFALTIILLPMSCALAVIKDRKNGTLQRSVVAGLQYSHTLIELLISQGIIVAVQVLLCYGIMVIAGIDIEGPVWQFLLLVFLVGMVGLSIGFLSGQAVDHEVESFFIILACYLPLMVSSGATWPFEGMPWLARAIYMCSPTALPIMSLRSIVTRGWGMTHPKVYPGFLMASFWIVALCVLSAIVKRIRNK